MEDPRQLKEEILKLTRRYSALVHRANLPGDDASRSFEAGKDTVPYAGRVFTQDEVDAAVSSTLDFWLTLGPEGEAFERELAEFLGVKKCLAVNSGSSANLVALSALTSHKLPEERRIRPGDEVITCAAGFPTTVAPILQNGAIPVFLDNDPLTGNANFSRLEEAYVPGKTKAVMIAHALGNPFDLATALAFCQRHNLWLIEDNCDALGSTYSLPLEKARGLGLDHLIRLAEKNVERSKGGMVEQKPNPSTLEPINSSTKIPHIQNGILTAYTGSFGDLSTQSFYPPHHMTMGEGGSVNIIKDMKLKVLAESFRDWGRDCWCASGKDNTCNKRFGWQLGELPLGYDHKYIYSHLGYNLKPLDPQAAIGRQQLKKLPAFVEARKRNWQALRAGLASLEEFFEFALPTHASGWEAGRRFNWQSGSGTHCDPSWFGFMMLVRPSAPFTRTEFVKYLDENKIGNRMLFGGNLVRQPAFVQLLLDWRTLRKDQDSNLIPPFRIVGQDPFESGRKTSTSHLLPGADRIMNESVFIGVYPGLTPLMISYMIEAIQAFVSKGANPKI